MELKLVSESTCGIRVDGGSTNLIAVIVLEAYPA